MDIITWGGANSIQKIEFDVKIQTAQEGQQLQGQRSVFQQRKYGEQRMTD